MRKSLIYFAFILNLAIIFGFWWSRSGGLLLSGEAVGTLLSLGRISGLLMVFFVMLQVLLIGRTSWIERLFGFDKLARVHRWSGYSLSIFLISHPLLTVWSYALESQVSYWNKLTNLFLYGEDIQGAIIAFMLFVIVIISSITIARRKLKYESWYFVHLSVYVAILAGFGHQLELGGDFQGQTIFSAYWVALYLFVFTNLLFFRFLRPAYNFWRYRFRVLKIVPETADTYSIYLTGQDLDKFNFLPGQFALFRFLTKGHFLQEHPFSFSDVSGKKLLRITIKKLGDYTADLSAITPGTFVMVDGPHGIFTPQRATGNKILVIAGGVGITPIRSLIDSFSVEKKDVVLLYGNKTEADIVFNRELNEYASAENLKVYNVLSADPNWLGEKGFIDEEKIKKLVPDLPARDIYLCGPGPMMRAVIGALRRLGVSRSKIYFEEFAL